jgi:5'-methylthioadenosine phosphorylase
MSERAQIGIIGGTGLYQMEGFTDVREVVVETPFGSPSDALMLGTLEGRRVAFLPRHARGHRLLPHELNYQANVFAMKLLGVEWILSVSAVGSLKEKYAPQHVVVPDQFIDRTLQRRSTFFGRGLVAHVAFAHPFCRPLSRVVADSCAEAGATHHVGGTYVCMEGPQFSTLEIGRASCRERV